MSRVFWLIVGAAGLFSLGNMARRGLMQDPRFMARPDFGGAHVPRWAGRELIDPLLASLGEMGPVSLLDMKFDDRIRGALADCAPVRRVVDVRRQWPRRYSVEVVFHRPVAVIERDGERHPVTHDFVVLPLEPYSHLSKRLYVIRGVPEKPPADGEVWTSEALKDGIATLAQLAPHLRQLRPLGIEAIDVSRARDPRGSVMLRTRSGIPVWWGRPRAKVGENSVAQKVRILATALERLDRLEGYEIDVRFNRTFVRRSNES